MITDKIRNAYRQFGLGGLFNRLIRFSARKLGVEYEDHYLLSLELGDYSLPVRKQLDGVEFRELSLTDFKESFSANNYLMLSPKKMEVIHNRLESGYKAFGAFYEGKLVYASWLSLVMLDLPGRNEGEKLNAQDAILLDDFCAPHMRQKGIHGAVNKMRLEYLIKNGYGRAYVVVMGVNKPALKSHLKNGFIVGFKYYTLSLFGHRFNDLDKKLNVYGYNR